MKKNFLSAGLCIALVAPLFAQNGLRQQIIQIIKPANGIIGVSVLGLETRDTVNYNSNARLVMQSVMKFPIALTVLHLVDSGVFGLDKPIHIRKRDMAKNTWSPLRDKFPDGDVDVTIGDLLAYMVSQSDNNACDILLKTIGGTTVVQSYLLSKGVRGIAVNATEAAMAADWGVQYTNWCKPAEMVKLLDLFYKGNLLTKPSTDFLYKLMTETTTGPNRIKGLLPAGTVVAHKTGTSSTSAGRLTPATNDAGIITLPNGKHLAIAVLVCNSIDDEVTREGVIAKVAKAAYEFYK